MATRRRYGAIRRIRARGEAIREIAPKALDLTNEKGTRGRALNEAQRASIHDKSRTRSRVEHVIGVMKNRFEFDKVRNKGLSKNTYQSVCIGGFGESGRIEGVSGGPV